MRFLCTLLTAAAIGAPLLAFTDEQIMLEVRRGGGPPEKVEIPVDSIEGISVVSDGPVRVEQDHKGMLATVHQAVKNASLRAVREISDGVRLLSQVQNGWAFLRIESQPAAFRSGVQLSVRVPRDVPKLRVQAGHGAVAVLGFTGDVEAEAVGGHMRLHRIGGAVSVRTGGGEINISEVGGEVSAYSGGGSISAQRVQGPAYFETEGGNIRVGKVGGSLRANSGGGSIEIDRANGSVSASTEQGVIRIARATGAVLAQTRDGSIKIGETKGVRAFSANGTIQVTGSSGPMHASTKVGDIFARVPSTSRLTASDLYTGAGDVTVYLSPKVSLTIQAACGGDQTRIISEFREIPVLPWTATGDNRRHAMGSLNGGGPLLRITAASGNIYIRRYGD